MTPTSTAQGIEATFSGELIRAGDERYDEARQLFSGAIDKHPALIARCRGSEDVRAALAHARDHALEGAVRGGGHSTAGHSSSDGGLVIDVAPIKHVDIDAAGRRGRFGAGLNWASSTPPRRSTAWP